MDVDINDDFYEGLVAGGYESFLGGLNVDDDEVEDSDNDGDDNNDGDEESSDSSNSDIEYEEHESNHKDKKYGKKPHSPSHSEKHRDVHLEIEETVTDDPDIVGYEETDAKADNMRVAINGAVDDKDNHEQNHDDSSSSESSDGETSSSDSDSDAEDLVHGGGKKSKARNKTKQKAPKMKPRLDNLMEDKTLAHIITIKDALGSSDMVGDFGDSPDITADVDTTVDVVNTTEGLADFGESPEVIDAPADTAAVSEPAGFGEALDLVGDAVNIETAMSMDAAVPSTLYDFGTSSDILTHETVTDEVTTDHTALLVNPTVHNDVAITASNSFGDAEDLFTAPVDSAITIDNSKIEIIQPDITGSAEAIFGAALKNYEL